MKALQIYEPGAFRIVDIPVPSINAQELLIRIEAVATCPRWDLLMYEGKDVLDLSRSPDYPIAAGWPGHEVAGIVTDIGKSVSKFKPGDRVVAHTVKPYTDGESGYAEYARFREDEIWPLPDHVSFEEAAPFELLKCVVRGMNQFGGPDAVRGKAIAVSGLGPAGLLAMQIARIWGARQIIGADISPNRIAYAAELGFGTVVHADRLPDYTFEFGFDCVGFAPSVQQLVRCASRHVVVFGVLHGEVKYTDELWLRGFKLECFDSSPLTEAELGMAMDALANQGLQTRCILTHRGLFREYGRVIDLLKMQEAIKVVFFPAREFGGEETGQ